MLFNLLSFTKRNTFLIALLLLVSPFMQADWFALNMTRGSTDISNEVFELHMLIFWICVAIGVIVFSVMFYSMWAHTKKKNPVPAKFHENHKLEIAWTIIPFLILIAMAVPASKTLVKIYDDEAGDINIQVTGYQWKWQYRYLEDDVSFFSNLSTDLDEIYNLVPKGMALLSKGKESKELRHRLNYLKKLRKDKIDLGVGVYKDAEGNTPIMRAIKEAENRLWKVESTKTYTAMPGDSGFHNAMADLVLADSVDRDRLSFCATPGGTGAIHHVLELVKLTESNPKIWFSDPTWGNHLTIAKHLNMPIRKYSYFKLTWRKS